MNIEDVKNKIKKLIALSEDNPSDEESHSALQKAQELMAKYKLDRMDITEEEIKKCIRRKTALSYGTRSSDHYLSDLAKIIADNFCCITYVSTARGSRTHYICFMGMEEDVEIACDVLYAANNAIIRGYNKVYRDIQNSIYDGEYVPASYFNPRKVGYIEGYLDALRKVLEDQKAANQEWGLVLVVPKEAQDFVDGLESVSFGGVVSMSSRYYSEGYSDGSKFELDKKINGSTAQASLN